MALSWFKHKNDDVEPNLHEFNAYFLMPIAADGRLSHLEETPLQTALFVYGLDVLMDRNPEATTGSLKEAIRAAKRDPDVVDNWDPQEAWNSINRQSRPMTECEYWYVQVWLDTEAKRLGRPFEARTKPGRFAQPSDKPHVLASMAQWITTVADEEPSPDSQDAAPAETAPASADEASPAGPAATVGEAAPSESQQAPAAPAELDHRICDLPAETVKRLVREVLLESELKGPCSTRAEEIVAAVESLLEADDLPGLAFDEFRGGPGNQTVAVDRLPPNADLWFVGDIHGDVLALRAALEYLDAVSRNDLRQPCVVLLGDVFDRGVMGYQAVLQVFHELLVRGRQFCVLTGNHDEALGYREGEDAFIASVSPFELAEWLNDHRDDVTRRLGRAVVRLFATTPRALLLPDGLLAAHGGVPLRDLAETFTCADDLDAPACLQDFVWTRAHPRARFKYVNRNSRTCEFGYEDFEFFCERAEEVLDRPVRRMVRGHDHVEHRFMLYERYVRNPMLTINTMCYSQDEMGSYERMPCIARYVPGRLPQVHQLRIPAEAIRRVYPPHDGADDV